MGRTPSVTYVFDAFAASQSSITVVLTVSQGRVGPRTTTSRSFTVPRRRRTTRGRPVRAGRWSYDHEPIPPRMTLRAGSVRLVLVALLGAGLTLGSGCSSSSARPAVGTTTIVASPTTSASPTAPGSSSTTSEVFSAEKLPVQAALGVLRQLFVAGGLDPDDQHNVSVRLRACPLGQAQQLTATPPAFVAGLGGSAVFTMNRSRGAVLDAICRFSKSPPAAATTRADSATGEVQYDASYVPPDQLKEYLRVLDDSGFVKRPDRFIDGIVYSQCSAPDGPTTTVASSSSCAALWYYRQLVVGVQFGGPGTAADVTPWLTSVVAPIVQALAGTDPASVVAPPPVASTTTSG